MAADRDGVSPSPMTLGGRELLQKAKELSYDERRALAQALWDSLESELASLSLERAAGIRDRIGQLERGEVRAIPWSEVEARLRRTLGQDAGAFEVPEDFDEPLSEV